MSRRVQQVAFQLDYFMSSQFAGVAMAMRGGLYTKAGIDLRLLPTCPPGEEARVVHEGYRGGGGRSLWVGCMEQNTLLPAIAAGSHVKAVAAMFGRSPLCLAGLPGSNLRAQVQEGARLRIAAHEDTVDLLRRIVPSAEVLAHPREKKLQGLTTGEFDAIQAYDVMETLKIARETKEEPEVLRLEGPAFPGVALGYSQVLFAPAPALQEAKHRAALRDFLHATFEGWNQAIRSPEAAADLLLEMQGDCEHWVSDEAFVQQSVRLCCDYVKRTKRCGELGMIEPRRWRDAAEWLGTGPVSESVDTSLWRVDDHHVDAQPVAELVRKEAEQLAADAHALNSRPPRLAVVTVGDGAVGATHPEGRRRLEVMGLSGASWFCKAEAGTAMGVDVREVNLPMEATTQEVVQAIVAQLDVDGIQLMWPLPGSVDAAVCLKAIPAAQDVDGHMDGLRFLEKGPEAAAKVPDVGPPPVACDGVARILDHYGVKLEGARVAILGRSWLFGQPLARLLQARGASVEVAHSGSGDEDIQAMCRRADVVIPAMGKPELVQGAWIRPGAVVVNVGTTFQDDDLVPDIAPLEDLRHAGLVVRTIGPISVAMLMKNVARKALAAPRP